MDPQTRTTGLLACAGVSMLAAVVLLVVVASREAEPTEPTRPAVAYRPPIYREPIDTRRIPSFPPDDLPEYSDPPELPPDHSEPVSQSHSEALKIAIAQAQRKAEAADRAEEERRRSADEAVRKKAEADAKKKADELAAQDAKGAKTYLQASQLQVGAVGRPYKIVGKVLQIIDSQRMLVGVDDERTNNGKYATWILLICPAGSFIEGRILHGPWYDVLGKRGYLVVTGTVTIRGKAVLAVEARKR